MERAIEMLLKKIKNEPFESELPMEVWDDMPPAPPLAQVKDRKIALVTTSGVVPWGNPDRFQDVPQYPLAKIQYCRAQRA